MYYLVCVLFIQCFKLTAGANEAAIAIGLKKIVTVLYTPSSDTTSPVDNVGKNGVIDIYAQDSLFVSIPVEV